MNLKLQIIFISFLILGTSTQIYVSPNRSCLTECVGSLDQPYDSLWIALKQAEYTSNLEVILLKGDHFLLTSEQASPVEQLYDLGHNVGLVGNVIIRPLFCDEASVLINSTLLSQCIYRDERINLFLKTHNFEILVSGNLEIISIMISGIEDIQSFNKQSEELSTCLYERTFCCSHNAELNNEEIHCEMQNFEIFEKPIQNANIILDARGGIFSMSNVIIININLIERKSFIQFESSNIMKINNLEIGNSFFQDGFLNSNSLINSESSSILASDIIVVRHNSMNIEVQSEETISILFSGQFSNVNIINFEFLDSQISNPTNLFSLNNAELKIEDWNFVSLILNNENELISIYDSKATLNNIKISNNTLLGQSLLYLNQTETNLTNVELIQNKFSGYSNFMSAFMSSISSTSLNLVENQAFDMSKLIMLKNSQLEFTGSVFTNNSLYDNSMMFFAIDSSIIRILDLQLLLQTQYNQSTGYSIQGKSTFTCLSCVHNTLNFFDSSIFIMVISTSDLNLESSKFASVVVESESTMIGIIEDGYMSLDSVQFIDIIRQKNYEGVNMGIAPPIESFIISYDSELFFTNIILSRSSDLLSTFNTSINIVGFQGRNLESIDGSPRRMISVDQSILNAENVILTFPNIDYYVNFEDQWFTITDSVTNLESISIRNFHGSAGYIFQFIDSEASISQMNVQSSYFKTNGQVFSIQGESIIDIESSTFNQISNLLVANECPYIRLSNLEINTTQAHRISISIFQAGEILIENCSFSVNSVGLNSLILFSEVSKKINLDGLSINDLVTLTGAIQVIMQKNPAIMTVKNSIFNKITSLNSAGAAISFQCLQPSTILIENSTFTQNTALNNPGGGIFFNKYIDTKHPPTIVIIDSVFKRNQALYGAALYMGNVLPAIDEFTQFESNYAGSTQNDIFTQVVDLVSTNQLNNQLLFTNLTSGSCHLSLKLVDIYSQVAFFDNQSNLQVQNYSKGLGLLQKQFNAHDGVFDLSSGGFTYTPGEQAEIILEVDTPYGSVSSKNLILQFRECLPGEMIESDVCVSCNTGYFSVGGTSQCQSCDIKKMNCINNIAIPNQGYWKMNAQSDMVIRCPTFDNCINENIGSSESCAENSEGNLCAGCESGYQKISYTGNCESLSEKSLGLGEFMLAFSLTIIVLYVLAKNLKTGFKIQKLQQIRNKNEENIFVIKEFISHMQVIILVFGLSPDQMSRIFSWITFLDKYLSGMIFMISSWGYSITVTQNLLLINLLPILVLSVLFGTQSIISHLQKKNISFKNFNPLLFSLAAVLYLFQMLLIRENAALLLCQNLYRSDIPQSYSLFDPQLLCWSEEHINLVGWFSIPTLVFWLLILPYYCRKQISPNNSFLYLLGAGNFENGHRYEVKVYILKLSLLVLQGVSWVYNELLGNVAGLFIMLIFFTKSFSKKLLDRSDENLERQIMSLAGLILCLCYFLRFALQQFFNPSKSVQNGIADVGLTASLILFILVFLKIVSSNLKDSEGKFGKVCTIVERYVEKMMRPLLCISISNEFKEPNDVPMKSEKVQVNQFNQEKLEDQQNSPATPRHAAVRVDTPSPETCRVGQLMEVQTRYKPNYFVDSPTNYHEDSSPDVLIRNKKSKLRKSMTMKNLKKTENNTEISMNDSSNNFKELMEINPKQTEPMREGNKYKESRFKLESKLHQVEKHEQQVYVHQISLYRKFH